MRSKTSLFNAPLLKKNLTRYSPLWGGATLGLLLIIFLVLSGNDKDYWMVAHLIEPVRVCSLAVCPYALVCALLLFGDLYNSRMCYTLHAMPVSRKGIFAANLVSGLLFCLIPTTAAALLALPWLSGNQAVPNAGMLSLYGWCVANLQYLFFFGLATFCAMCVGNRVGLALSYGLLNIASLGIYLLVDLVFTPLLYGIVTPYGFFDKGCPVLYMTGLDYVNLIRTGPVGTIQDFQGTLVLDTGWQYLAVTAGIGLVLILLGYLLYLGRKLETAGDLVAVKALRPWGLVAAALATGTILVYMEVSALDTHWGKPVFLVLGLAIGWFAGLMLIERSSRVFTRSNWIRLGVLTLAVALAAGITRLDPLGIVYRIPEQQEVDSVLLDSYGSYLMDTQEQIRDALQLHALGLQSQECFPDKDSADRDAIVYTLKYTLKNGRVVNRTYLVRNDGQAAALLKKHLSSIPLLFQRFTERSDSELTVSTPEDVQFLKQPPREIRIYGPNAQRILIGEEAESFIAPLVDAIIADCQAGTLAQHPYLHPHAIDSEGLRFNSYSISVYYPNAIPLYIEIYSDCENTISCLETIGLSSENLFLDVG